MKKMMLLLMVVLLLGCTNPQKAKEVLEADGYTNVQITGYVLFACSKDDFYHTGFVAQKNGRSVKGTVCEGFLFKGSTIRFD